MTADNFPPQAPQRVIPARRKYNAWVNDESIEDYALRYAPRSIRKWSLWTVSNTAFSSVCFLAMEAIGATMIWQYGYYNAVYALIVVSILIFLTSWPISYYAATYNVDIDLLTRGAGFGYIGSTITSLIYASFTFIFLAFEAAILALALKFALQLPLFIGYLISSLIIIPLVIRGVGYINKFQSITQPIWLVLLLLPWFFVFSHHPQLLNETQHYIGEKTDSLGFDLVAFGAACTLLFALITQVGEQVDYLRFLPDKTQQNKLKWHSAVFLGGPAWIVFGAVKIFFGMLLMILALSYLVPLNQVNNPTYLYWIAYRQVVDNNSLALLLMLLFVVISQMKINVTNAYAGSLAWSNFFARITHYHPGRIVWLVFNVFIAILLMELGIMHAVEQVLGLYSHIALAWIGAIVADLIICKPLGLSPKGIEFRRAYLYDFNPVGVGALLIASTLSILCYLDFFGHAAQALSGFIALSCAMLCAPAIAFMTGGKYYLARHLPNEPIKCQTLCQCIVCQHDFEAADTAFCPAYNNTICSLCCALDARCHDLCKPYGRWSSQLNQVFTKLLPAQWSAGLNNQLTLFFLVLLILAVILAVSLSLIYTLEINLFQQMDLSGSSHLLSLFIKIFAVLFLLICVAAWWLVLNDLSRRNAEQESQTQNQLLLEEIAAHQITDQHLQDARNQAESANQAKSRYLIGISHELRTPLNSILGYSQLIEKQERLSQQGQKALHVINRSGQHLTALIDGLLDLARIETGKISLNLSVLQLPNFIDQIIKMFEPQFRQKKIYFSCDISYTLPSYVHIDQKRLEQILINLLGNALKFTARGFVRFKVDYRFQTALFEIEDSGCGIAEHDIQRIFHPFERGSNVEHSGFSGTGLGLSIVKLLIDLLGGQMEVSSELGKGTLFKIKLYLPSKDVIHPITNSQNQFIQGYLGPRQKILIVDNEMVDRELIRNYLEPLGFIVDEAESGLVCLQMVPICCPDLILMDLGMPVIDGWETARILRQNQISNVPIMIISADANQRSNNAETYIANDDFLVKPVDLNFLLTKIGDKLALQWLSLSDSAQPRVQSEPVMSQLDVEECQPSAQLASQSSSLGQATTASPSLASMLNSLSELISQGYIRGIKENLSHCQQHYPNQMQLWQELMQFTEKFDLKAALQRVKQYQESQLHE